MKRMICLAIALSCLSIPAIAAPVKPAAKGAPIQGIKRQKVIDFEDSLVEGVNKRPLDSLSQVSEKNKGKKRPHLYRKRAGFGTETRQTLNDLRYGS